MPDVRLPEELKTAIEKQPERTRLHLSFTKTTCIIIEEALRERATKLKRGPRLRDR